MENAIRANGNLSCTVRRKEMHPDTIDAAFNTQISSTIVIGVRKNAVPQREDGDKAEVNRQVAVAVAFTPAPT